jgi:hypothetical protein
MHSLLRLIVVTTRNEQPGTAGRFSGRLAGEAITRGSYRVTATPAHGKARTTRLAAPGRRTRHRA